MQDNTPRGVLVCPDFVQTKGAGGGASQRKRRLRNFMSRSFVPSPRCRGSRPGNPSSSVCVSFRVMRYSPGGVFVRSAEMESTIVLSTISLSTRVGFATLFGTRVSMPPAPPPAPAVASPLLSFPSLTPPSPLPPVFPCPPRPLLAPHLSSLLSPFSTGSDGEMTLVAGESVPWPGNTRDSLSWPTTECS